MAIQDSDAFLVARNGTNYQTPASNLMAIQDTDLLAVNRGGTNYKVTGLEVKQYAGTGYGDVIPVANAAVFGSQSNNVIANIDATRSNYPQWLIVSKSPGPSVSQGEDAFYIKLNGGPPSGLTFVNQKNAYFSGCAKGACVVVSSDRVFIIGGSVADGGTSFAYNYGTAPLSEMLTAFDGAGTWSPSFSEIFKTVTTASVSVRGWFDEVVNKAYFLISNSGVITLRSYNGSSGTFIEQITLTSGNTYFSVNSEDGILYFQTGTSPNYSYGDYDYRNNTISRAAAPLPSGGALFVVYSAYSYTNYPIISNPSTGTKYGDTWDLKSRSQSYPQVLPQEGTLLTFKNNSGVYSSGGSGTTLPGDYVSYGGETATYIGISPVANSLSYAVAPKLINQVSNVLWTFNGTTGVTDSPYMSIIIG